MENEILFQNAKVKKRKEKKKLRSQNLVIFFIFYKALSFATGNINYEALNF